MINNKFFFYITFFLLVFILYVNPHNFLFLNTIHFLIIDNTDNMYNYYWNFNNYDILQYTNNSIELNNSGDSINYYNNFKNGVKSRLFWIGWERYKDKYNSFEEFKKVWDSNIKIRKIIKNDIKNEFEGLIRTKNVIRWLLDRRNPDNAKEYKRPKNFTPVFIDIAKVFKKK